MNKKIRRNLVALALLALMIPASIVTLAYFRAETSTANKLSSGNIGIKLMDTSHDQQIEMNDNELLFGLKYPGAVVEKETVVKNVKDFPLYVRIKVTKFWEDGHGDKLSKADAAFVETVTKDETNWIIKKDDRNHEVEYYYYKMPLKSDQVSDPFIDQISLSGKITGKEELDYTQAQIVIKYEADAIQELGAEKAMLAEWGLRVSIDENGRMNEVED